MRWVTGLFGVLIVILLLAIGVAWFTTRVDSSKTEGPPPVTITAAGAQPREGERAVPTPKPAPGMADRTPPSSPPRPADSPMPGKGREPPGAASASKDRSGGSASAPDQLHRVQSDAGTPYALDRDGIKGAITSKLPEIKDCYEAWLAQNAALSGRMTVAFTISADDAGEAEVTRIALVDGGVGHVLMEGCVLNVFHDLRFERPEGRDSIEVHYPLAFSNDRDGG